MESIGILLALIVLIVLSMKGFDLITTTTVAALVVIVTNSLDWQEALLNGYMTSFVGFTKSWLFVMVLGALFGRIMSESKSAHTMAGWMTGKMGGGYAVLAIGIVSCVFTLLGISGFVIMFVIAPLAQVVMKENNIPRTLLPAIISLGTVPACGTLPYSIDVTNMIPTEYLGTNLGAAPGLGLLGGLIIFGLGYWYIMNTSKKFQKQMSQEDIDATYAGVELPNEDRTTWPPLWKAILPLADVIAVVLIAQNHMDAIPSVILALSSACIIGILLNWKTLLHKPQLIRSGVENGLISLATASSVIGFSGVIQLSPAFPNIIEGIMSMNIHPYFTEYIGVNIIAGIVGSSTAGVTIFMQNLAQRFLDMGMNPAAIHRIAPVSAAGLNTLPNSISASLTISYTKLTYRNSYFHMFMCSVVFPLIAGLCVTTLCVMGFVF